VIEQDTLRARYLSPEEAVQYGLIDRVLNPLDLKEEIKVLVKCELQYGIHLLILNINLLFFLSNKRNDRKRNFWIFCKDAKISEDVV
jgi:hypothetical protein